MKVFLVNGHPVFRCHDCGEGLDPITFLSKTRNISLDAAADLMVSEKAYIGDNIKGLLRKVRFVQSIVSFHNDKASEYKAKLDETRAFQFIREDDDSYMRDRSKVKLCDLLNVVPSLRSSIKAGKDKTREVILQLYRNHAGAPGKIDILSSEGNLIKDIILDDQPESSHLYFAAPSQMLFRPWDESVILFSSESDGALLWDWISDTVQGEGDLAVLAIHSISGDIRRIDAKKVTVLTIGDDTAWAGTIYSSGNFSQVRVLRLEKNPRRMSAREVLYPIFSAQRWGELPSVTEDFIGLVTGAFRSHKNGLVKAIIEDTAKKSYLPLSTRTAAMEKLKVSLPTDGQMDIDRIIEEISLSTQFRHEEYVYTAVQDHFVRESESRRNPVTNFRTRIVARVKQTSLRNSEGTPIYVLRTRLQGFDGTVTSLIPEPDFYKPLRLISTLRESCIKAGAPVPVISSSYDERRLPRFIEGTQTGVPEIVEFPCLGIDRNTFSFNFPDLGIFSNGDRLRPISNEGLAEALSGNILPRHNEGSDRELVDMATGDSPENEAIQDAIGFAAWFLFRAVRAPSHFRAYLSSGRFANLVAKVSGMKRIDNQWMIDNSSSLLSTKEVPCMIDGVPSWWARKVFRKFIYSGTSDDQKEFFSDMDIPPEIDDLMMDSIPSGRLSSFTRAAIISGSVDEISYHLFPALMPEETRSAIHLAIMNAARSYMGEVEQLLEFLRGPEGREFLTHVGDGRVIISSLALHRVFGENSVPPRRIFEQLRCRCGGDIEAISRRPARIREWSIPVNVLTGEDKILEFQA